ncbi:MAG TPA: SAF domain-containing protein [Solirubrobacterales bacterium]|jgi:Flp pilus assembly protein CpaB|nr:SAF domain-containing protein [Solirubrobacterales bacterium]
MSRRGRAVAFLLLAALAATAAAAIADGYGASVTSGYGPLRPVVVIASRLSAGRPLSARDLEAALAVRRVPQRFVPAGALASPAEALGLVPQSELGRGSYLLAGQLAVPHPKSEPRRGLPGGRRPVEIAVGGAGVLLAAGPVPGGTRVDVVVTAEPQAAGPGRTYVAAPAVPLLALRPEGEGAAGSGVAAATLGLTRRQALRLIAAESFARKITLLPGG